MILEEWNMKYSLFISFRETDEHDYIVKAISIHSDVLTTEEESELGENVYKAMSDSIASSLERGDFYGK